MGKDSPGPTSARRTCPRPKWKQAGPTDNKGPLADNFRNATNNKSLHMDCWHLGREYTMQPTKLRIQGIVFFDGLQHGPRRTHAAKSEMKESRHLHARSWLLRDTRETRSLHIAIMH